MSPLPCEKPEKYTGVEKGRPRHFSRSVISHLAPLLEPIHPTSGPLGAHLRCGGAAAGGLRGAVLRAAADGTAAAPFGEPDGHRASARRGMGSVFSAA